MCLEKGHQIPLNVLSEMNILAETPEEQALMKDMEDEGDNKEED